ncbi:MAG: arginine--tRNA ligase [bacterium]
MIRDRVKQLVAKATLSVTNKKQANFKMPKWILEHPDDLAHGDFAANIAMILAKELKENPKNLATEISEQLQLEKNELIKAVAVAGPGFINITLATEILQKELQNILEAKNKYGASTLGQNKKVIIEYSSPNVAKPMHVGHMRSTIIGDSLTRIFKFLGYDVVTDNHMGDWGVQFGILLYAYKHDGNKKKVEANPVQELAKLYQEMTQKINDQPDLREKGKKEFKKLEEGDEENLQLWKWFVEISLTEFEKLYNILGILPFDNKLGESFYKDKMQVVIDELLKKKIAAIDTDGSVFIDLEKYDLGRCILIKSDGATLYHTRDLATLKYRQQIYNYKKNVYVVASDQTHHFNQLFKIVELLGDKTGENVHVSFGMVRLPEGKMSTREGNVVDLEKFIDEAIKKAKKIIAEKNPDLPNKEEIAKKIGVGAIKYGDLSQSRTKNVTFVWDKMLSFDGDTGPYLQYTYARLQSILRKAETEIKEVSGDLKSEEEILARYLYRFPEIVEDAAKNYFPHTIANYLYDLAKMINSYYQKVPVLKATENKELKLAIVKASAEILKNGLLLLGIETVEEM